MMSPAALDAVGGDGLLTELLIDRLDLDRDGTAEVLTYSLSFEGGPTKFISGGAAAGAWPTPFTATVAPTS